MDVNFCKHVKQIKMAEQKKMELKWNLPLKAILFIFHCICYYKFISIYFFTRNDKWLPTNFWLLGNSVLLINCLFWSCKCYAQAPKTSASFQIPINLLLSYCLFYCVFAWFQTLSSTLYLRFGLWIFLFDAYFWPPGSGLCAQSDHLWFKLTLYFQDTKIYTLWF